MLRITLISLVVIVVAIIFFGCKMKSVQTSKVDRVTAVEQMMNQ